MRFTHEPPVARDERFAVPYALTMGDFSNRGTWGVILARDGRIQILEHRPDPLPPSEHAP